MLKKDNSILYNMAYKIIFSGTGGGRFVMSQQLRSTAGIILELGNALFCLDPGPGALVKLKNFNINPKQIDAIFASHSHIDHSNDVNALIDSMTYGGLEKRGEVFVSESFADDNSILSSLHKTFLNRIEIMKPGKQIQIKGIHVQALRTKHSDETCVGYKFFTDRFVLSYSADTEYFADLAKEYMGSDILILNAQRPSKSPKNGPLSSDDCVSIIKKVNPKITILTHFGMNMLKANPIYEAREIQKKTDSVVVAASDNFILDPLAYSTKGRQKILI